MGGSQLLLRVHNACTTLRNINRGKRYIINLFKFGASNKYTKDRYTYHTSKCVYI